MNDDRGTIVECARCKGTGTIRNQPGLGIVYDLVTCPACKGSGKQRLL